MEQMEVTEEPLRSLLTKTIHIFCLQYIAMSVVVREASLAVMVIQDTKVWAAMEVQGISGESYGLTLLCIIILTAEDRKEIVGYRYRCTSNCIGYASSSTSTSLVRAGSAIGSGRYVQKHCCSLLVIFHLSTN